MLLWKVVTEEISGSDDSGIHCSVDRFSLWCEIGSVFDAIYSVMRVHNCLCLSFSIHLDYLKHFQKSQGRFHPIHSPADLWNSVDQGSYHIPHEIGEPVDDRLHSTDELQVLCFADPLLDQEHNKAGRDEGHREDDTDGHEDIHWCGHSEKERQWGDEGPRMQLRTQSSKIHARTRKRTHGFLRSEAYHRGKKPIDQCILFRVQDDYFQLKKSW